MEVSLYEKALNAAKEAYAPYSQFRVGVAALLCNGKIVTGSNQENAAYPSGICAERTALFYAGSRYPEVAVETLLIIAITGGEVADKISPCGACRQVMVEMEQRGKRPMRTMLCSADEALVIKRASDLLPLSFELDNK